MSIKDFQLEYFSLKGKTALITGGNGGLGEAFAYALAKAGAAVFVVSVDGDRRFLDGMNELGVKTGFMLGDITADGQAQKVVEQCILELGSLDILVNCAGVNLLADVTDFDREPWDKTIAVNLTAAFELSHHAAKHMIQRKQGKIINICSLFSFLGGRRSPAYAASKHGLSGLTKAYCDELAEYNIQVNGIAPGYFATDLTTQTRLNPELNATVLKHIPANRWGEREDLMGAIVFLASQASNYVNGHILTVDGGYLVR